MTTLFRKYFILYIIFVVLTACGADTNRSGTSASPELLIPMTVTKAASSSAPTVQQQYEVVRLMLALFNAAPGSINLNYLAGYLASGASATELAKLLAQTDSFKSPLLYPTTLSSQQFATKFIDNLVGATAHYLNKASLAEAVAYYLDNGYSRGEIVWLTASALAAIPVTDPNWGRASAQFANKVDVAYYFSVSSPLSANDLGALQAAVLPVTDDPATVIAAKATKPVNLPPSWASVGIAGASRQITLNWTKTATATKAATSTSSYTIYWSTKPGVTKLTGARIANATSPYTHTGLGNGITYYYVVTETTAGIEGPESLEVATSPQAPLPPAPTGITVASLDRAVQLAIGTTTSGTAGSTKYNLYWSTSASMTNATKIVGAFGSATTFLHSGLTNGAMYYYGVTAETPEGEGPMSKPVAATPLADINAVNYQFGQSSAKLAAPKSVSAIAASQQVALSWDMPVNQIPTTFDPMGTPTQPPVITSYTIYWSTSLIADIKKANKITAPVTENTTLPMTFVHNTGLTNNQTYYYIITAVAAADAAGNALKTADGRTLTFESPIGAQIMVTPTGRTPAAPTGLSATSGAQKITLAWTSSSTSGAYYRLYVSDKLPAKPEDLVIPKNLVTASATSPFIHSGLQSGITYYYVATAVIDGESAPTAVASVALR